MSVPDRPARAGAALRLALLALLHGVAGVIFTAALAPAPAEARRGEALGPTVVTVVVTAQAWDIGQPWTKATPATRVGAGVVVRGPRGLRLLTSAGLLTDATLVRVMKNGSNVEAIASLVHVDREQNLALITVEEPGFYDDLRPVRFVPQPVVDGAITLLRWRGGQLETAEGRVSRPTVIDTATGVSDMVTLRVSADLSGGGGEPMFRRRELVGVAVGKLGDELSVVPAAHLRRWVAEAEVDPRPWAGTLALSVQPVRGQDMVGWLGLDRARGLLITGVPTGSAACGRLRRGDVLLQVDGLELDGDGNVPHPDYGRLYYEFLIGQRREGEALGVQILREGQTLDLQLPLRAYTGAHWLVPADGVEPPAYLMVGGLVFRELTDGTPTRSPEMRVVSTLSRQAETAERRRVIILSSVLPDPYNLGYHGEADRVVSKVNGQIIDSVDDLVEAFKAPLDGFHVVEFSPNPGITELVLDAEGLEAATARIAAAYGVAEVLRLPAPPPALGACASGG